MASSPGVQVKLYPQTSPPKLCDTTECIPGPRHKFLRVVCYCGLKKMPYQGPGIWWV